MERRILPDKLKPGSTNIFDLADPDSYGCFIERYQVGQGVLRIRAYKEGKSQEDALSLVFDSPQYFEGPTSWTGANFCVASVEESAALFRKLDWVDDTFARDQIAEVLDMIHLLTVPCSGNFHVRLVISNASILSEDAPSSAEHEDS
jgi:hypothetical protein